jgi:hypothetical protein
MEYPYLQELYNKPAESNQHPHSIFFYEDFININWTKDILCARNIQ